MRVIRGADISFEPASHEDPNNPGVYKRILARRGDFFDGRVQMLNWAKLPPKSGFSRHYHEDMQEIFIILDGRIRTVVDGTVADLGPGDCIFVEPGERHQFTNRETRDVHYIVFGIAGTKSGKTVLHPEEN